MMYGIKCSTTIAQTALQIILEEELKECDCKGQENLAPTCPGMAHLLNDVISTIYVDDLFNDQDDLQKAKDLMGYIDRTLEKYGFKIKGWTYTGQPYSPDDPVRDEHGMVTTAGSIYCPQDDTWQYKPAKVHNGRKQRGLVIEEKNYYYYEGNTRLKNKPAALRSEDFMFAKGLTREKLMNIFIDTRKTLRLILSKSASVYDPPGLLSGLINQLCDVV